jgi:hypothetical protein
MARSNLDCTTALCCGLHIFFSFFFCTKSSQEQNLLVDDDLAPSCESCHGPGSGSLEPCHAESSTRVYVRVDARAYAPLKFPVRSRMVFEETVLGIRSPDPLFFSLFLGKSRSLDLFRKSAHSQWLGTQMATHSLARPLARDLPPLHSLLTALAVSS